VARRLCESRARPAEGAPARATRPFDTAAGGVLHRTVRRAHRAYRRWMRRTPDLHPSSTLFGTGPRHDGLWVSVWTTAGPVVCVTVGVAPGDASTVTCSIHASDAQAAVVAARGRLSALADRAGGIPRGTVHAASVAAPAAEGPVDTGVTRAALRNCCGW
jgi:hypothetical protein